MSKLASLNAAPNARAIRNFVLLAAASGLLAACGSTPMRSADGGPGADKAGGDTVVRRPSTKGGGYYRDDGPHENPPENLDQVPNAQPRVDPLHRFANRPYTVLGQTFVPATSIEPYRARGHASWYGRKFHGQPTSTGETYDMYAMTAAHPTLPIPSYARVTNVATGRSVIVRVNDRGPFLNGRLIDLSYTAAYKLGYVERGSAEVEVESILPDEIPMIAASQDDGAPLVAAVPVLAEPLAMSAPQPLVPVPAPRAAVPLPPLPALAAPAAPSPVPAAKAAGAASGVFLQLGAFVSRANAEGFRGLVEQEMNVLSNRLEVLAQDGRYRLHLGPFETVDEARRNADRIASVLKLQPFVVMR